MYVRIELTIEEDEVLEERHEIAFELRQLVHGTFSALERCLLSVPVLCFGIRIPLFVHVPGIFGNGHMGVRMHFSKHQICARERRACG
jgi:hypothetical protein